MKEIQWKQGRNKPSKLGEINHSILDGLFQLTENTMETL
jgi:hypothetical protein